MDRSWSKFSQPAARECYQLPPFGPRNAAKADAGPAAKCGPAYAVSGLVPG